MRRRGFTLVELLLALGLLSLLVIALVRLIDTSLSIWDRTETGRDLREKGDAVLGLVATDLSALEGGPRGDLVAEWVRFDLDRDGTPAAIWPRIRLVRRATPADRLRWRRTDDGGGADPRTIDLVEVCWALLPVDGAAPDARSVGLLWRGERLVGELDSTSFFDQRFFSSNGEPLPGSLEVVTGGVLWFEPWFAAQTSVVHDGWSLGDGLADCAASWDAWGRGRPNTELSWMNAPAAGMPRVKDAPVLPRRVRVTVEIERTEDLRLRTRLDATMEPDTGELSVADETLLPPAGSLVLVDEEWMRVLSVWRGGAGVARGERGTRPAPHAAGTLVHFGARFVREIPIGTSQEDWDL